jgi:predicted dehydrogenase
MTHRFYPEVREAYRLVQEGAIGDVVFLRDCVYEHFGFLNSPNWYLDPQHAGAGIVLSSGIHLVDRVLWFAGEMPSCVRGSMSNSFLHHSVEDAAQMSLEFPGGRSAQLSFGFLAEPHPLVSDLEIVGTRGSIIVHTWRGYELHTRAGTSVRDWYTDHPHMEKVLVGLRGEVAEFCRAIRNGEQPWPNVEESTCALQVVMEFYRAARSRVR